MIVEEKNDERYISIEESLIEACKEVKLMRAGKLPERDAKDFLKELKAMAKDSKN